MNKLAGKVALVTGGGRGIGRAICEAFAEQGAAIGVVDLKEEVALETVKAIEAKGGKAVALTCNVGNREEVFAAVENLKNTFGAPNILVNNAMWNRYGPLMDLNEDAINRMVDVGFKAVVWGYQAVLNEMIQAGAGNIINIGSPASVLAMRNGIMYSAVKSAVSGLTRSGAAEFGQYNIRVNAIAPSTTPTEGAKKVMSEDAWENRRSRMPLGRLCSTDDVAKAAVFLASDDASFISGDVLFVDGAATYALS